MNGISVDLRSIVFVSTLMVIPPTAATVVVAVVGACVVTIGSCAAKFTEVVATFNLTSAVLFKGFVG